VLPLWSGARARQPGYDPPHAGARHRRAAPLRGDTERELHELRARRARPGGPHPHRHPGALRRRQVAARVPDPVDRGDRTALLDPVAPLHLDPGESATRSAGGSSGAAFLPTRPGLVDVGGLPAGDHRHLRKARQLGQYRIRTGLLGLRPAHPGAGGRGFGLRSGAGSPTTPSNREARPSRSPSRQPRASSPARRRSSTSRWKSARSRRSISATTSRT
jgi:hypothetical protein